MSKVYILGASGQAREIYQIYFDNRLAKNVAGFIVTVPHSLNSIADKKVFGFEKFDEISKKDLLICAVGNSFKRRGWIESIDKRGFGYDTIVHKSVVRGSRVQIKEGTMVCAGSILTCDIKIGKHVLINIDSTVSHDVEIGNFVTLSPGVNIGGRVQIGEGTFIGIGASVIQDVKIGKDCFIGAGAVVTSDISDYTLAVGVPAKKIKTLSSADWERLI